MKALKITNLIFVIAILFFVLSGYVYSEIESSQPQESHFKTRFSKNQMNRRQLEGSKSKIPSFSNPIFPSHSSDFARINELDDDDINPDFYTAPLYNLLTEQFLLQKQQDQLQYWRNEIQRRLFINRQRQFDLAYQRDNGIYSNGYYEDRRAFVASADQTEENENEENTPKRSNIIEIPNETSSTFQNGFTIENDKVISKDSENDAEFDTPISIHDLSSKFARINEIDDDKNPDFYTDPEYDLLTEQYNLQRQNDELDDWQGLVERQWLRNRQRQLYFGRLWENNELPYDRRTGPV